MERVSGETLGAGTLRSERETPRNVRLDGSETAIRAWKACMNRLWAVMVERYGQLWILTRGEEWDGKTWSNDLEQLSPTDFARGVRADLERGGEYPPSAPLFLRMARQSSQNPAHAPLDASRRLPPPRPDTAVARLWRAYQQRHGLRNHGLSSDEVDEILDGINLDGMHATVRAHRQRVGEPDWQRLRYLGE